MATGSDPRRRRAPSLLVSWRYINKLEYLKDLLRHESRWAHQIGLARPLKKLGLDKKDPHVIELLRAKVNRMIPIARAAASRAQVATVVTRNEAVRGTHPTEYREAEYDVFVNHSDLMRKDHPSANYFNMTIEVIDQTIGYFREIRFRKLVGLLNPLVVIAMILRIPITIIEYMGFESTGRLQETILSVLVRSAWAVFLATAAVWFGKDSEVIKLLLSLLRKN